MHPEESESRAGESKREGKTEIIRVLFCRARERREEGGSTRIQEMAYRVFQRATQSRLEKFASRKNQRILFRAPQKPLAVIRALI